MERLVSLISTHEDWLMGQVLGYAKACGYAEYTSTLKEAWRLSIAGLSDSIIAGLRDGGAAPEFGPEDDFARCPVAQFGITEARRHRDRGVSFPMFLGLLKYYRQSYEDLVARAGLPPDFSASARHLLGRIFDRIEVALCSEWERASAVEPERIAALERSNRLMTNEKNKYLTVFESIPMPAILLNDGQEVENLNYAAAQLLDGAAVVPGGEYYSRGAQDRTVAANDAQDASVGICWLENELKHFAASESRRQVFMKTVDAGEAGPRTLNVGLSEMLDVSGKFSGTLVLFEDVTERQRMEEELVRYKDHLQVLLGDKTAKLQKVSEALEKESRHRKRAEEDLRQAQKMEAIGTLAGGIAHDFNNIISAILGYGELSLCDVPPESSLAQNLQAIISASHRAADLVRQILTFSRQSEQEQKPMRLQPEVKEALKLLRSTLPTTITIHQQIDPACGSIMADVTQMHQVLMNLCTNAYHAMRDHGGVMDVSLEEVAVDEATAARSVDLQPGRYATLTVRDTGHGMDPGTMSRIFEPYFTTKKQGEGTGLGLATVHGIVKTHRGAMTVASTPGVGTVFTVYFPLLVQSNGWAETAADMALPRLSGTVMLVDDDALILKVVQKLLSRLGCEVVAFQDSREALAAFRAEPEIFDVVVTDQTMPGLTGYHLAQQILSIRPGVPIVLATGFSETLTEKQVKAIGIREFLLKPLPMYTLGRTIARLLGQEPEPASPGGK